MSHLPMIIDTDTASDDAVAIVMALQHPDVEVEAITVVSGNVSVAQGSINARYTVELCGADVPVYEGCRQPLLRPTANAHWFHGEDGMGNMHYPAPKQPAAAEHAVDELLRRFGERPGELTLVTLGPLTNIATALMREPKLAQWVKQCYVMGGTANKVGNVTPAAEFNIWCDPEAAQIVFHSGMKLMMTGWELCREDAEFDAAERDELVALGPLGKFTVDCNRRAIEAIQTLQNGTGLGLPDPVTMAITIEPELALRCSTHNVEVICDSELTRGMTLVDQLDVTDRPKNVEVCWELDVPGWKSLLRRLLV